MSVRWAVGISGCIASLTGDSSSLSFPFEKAFSLSILAAIASLALFTAYQTTSVSAILLAAVLADVLPRYHVRICSSDELERRRAEERHRGDVDVL